MVGLLDLIDRGDKEERRHQTYRLFSQKGIGKMVGISAGTIITYVTTAASD